jgi:hypothetical protein
MLYGQALTFAQASDEVAQFFTAPAADGSIEFGTPQTDTWRKVPAPAIFASMTPQSQ